MLLIRSAKHLFKNQLLIRYSYSPGSKIRCLLAEPIFGVQTVYFAMKFDITHAFVES